MTTDEIPECCGEPMCPTDRFVEKGDMYRRFLCGSCLNSKTIKLEEDTYEECVRRDV